MSLILDALRRAEHSKSEHQKIRLPTPTIRDDAIPKRPGAQAPAGLLWILPGMLMLAFGIWALLPKVTIPIDEKPLPQQTVDTTQLSTPDAADRIVATSATPNNASKRVSDATITSSGKSNTDTRAVEAASSVTSQSVEPVRRNTGARALDRVARQAQSQTAAASTQASVANPTVETASAEPRVRFTNTPPTPGTVTIAPAGSLEELNTPSASPSTQVDRTNPITTADTPPAAPTSAAIETGRALTRPAGSVDQEVLPEYRTAVAQGKVALPKISLDMHVYSNTPSKRFVFINLNKLGEGEQLDSNTSVESILPNGAVLNHQGYRFIIRPD